MTPKNESDFRAQHIFLFTTYWLVYTLTVDVVFHITKHIDWLYPMFRDTADVNKHLEALENITDLNDISCLVFGLWIRDMNHF